MNLVLMASQTAAPPGPMPEELAAVAALSAALAAVLAIPGLTATEASAARSCLSAASSLIAERVGRRAVGV